MRVKERKRGKNKDGQKMTTVQLSFKAALQDMAEPWLSSTKLAPPFNSTVRLRWQMTNSKLQRPQNPPCTNWHMLINAIHVETRDGLRAGSPVAELTGTPELQGDGQHSSRSRKGCARERTRGHIFQEELADNGWLEGAPWSMCMHAYSKLSKR